MTRCRHSRVHLKLHNTEQPADISRLLDPSYTAQQHITSATVYVDYRGDLHDPDYRDFPVAPKKQPAFHLSRPRWELADSDYALDMAEYEEDDFPHYQHHSSSRRGSRNTSSPTPSPYKTFPYQQHRDSFTSANRTTATSSTSPTYSFTPSSPTSYDSHDTVLSEVDDSPFADEKRNTSGRWSKRRVPKLAPRSIHRVSEEDATFFPNSRRSSREDSHPVQLEPQYVQEEAEEAEVDGADGLRETTTDATPTCTQSLRRQWVALSLYFQMGAFRAQRGLRKRVHSLL